MNKNSGVSWDIKRFWETLVYFEIIPFVSCWQRFFNKTKTNSNYQPVHMKNALVIAPENDVKQEIINLLLKRQHSVITLGENNLKQPGVITIEGNINNFSTWQEQIAGKVTSIIYFFNPPSTSLVSPEMSSTENYQEIHNLTQIASKLLSSNTGQMLFDFTHSTTDMKETWGAVDDVVMGGVSQSNLRISNDKAIFSGVVSTDNNGGFASVRTRNFEPPLNLASYQGVELRLIGDGKRYKFITRCEGKWDGISYCYSFDTIYNFPITVAIPFVDLIPVFRAKTVEDAGEFDASRIYSMQLMLSKFEYDGELNPKFEPGSFNLQVEYIKVYGDESQPELIIAVPENNSDRVVQQAFESIIKPRKINYSVVNYNALLERLSMS